MKMNPDSIRNIPNVLIVDDVPANLKVLGNILRGEGYKVRPVPNGELALLVAENEKPDIILLDIMMPGIDGYEVCRQFKNNPKLNEVPVIFISALNDTDAIVKAFASGGVDYISKPFRAEEVKARVETHINLHRQKKALEKQSQELERLNATKDKFFSIIAHDLRSPFASFLGLTEMMVSEVKTLTIGEIEKLLKVMNLSATNLFGLLNNLLEWSRMQKGAVPFEPASFLLMPKIFSSMQQIMEMANKKDITFSYQVPQDLIIFADANMFESTIRNLATNAIKFTPRGGIIRLSAQAEIHNTVEISIQDSGIGMDQEILRKLFSLDEHPGRKGTENEPSTGLGLVICKEFIQKHGGEIWAESEVGTGSTFHFTLSNQA